MKSSKQSEEFPNLPHRIIYLSFGMKTTRVVGNREAALAFAADKENPYIQLATEDPKITPRKRPKMMQGTNRVPCECGGGKRLSSEKNCVVCRGLRTSERVV